MSIAIDKYIENRRFRRVGSCGYGGWEVSWTDLGSREATGVAPSCLKVSGPVSPGVILSSRLNAWERERGKWRCGSWDPQVGEQKGVPAQRCVCVCVCSAYTHVYIYTQRYTHAEGERVAPFSLSMVRVSSWLGGIHCHWREIFAVQSSVYVSLF